MLRLTTNVWLARISAIADVSLAILRGSGAFTELSRVLTEFRVNSPFDFTDIAAALCVFWGGAPCPATDVSREGDQLRVFGV